MKPQDMYVQVFDKKNSEQIHQERPDAKRQKAYEGNRMSAEAPIKVTLLRLYLLHCGANNQNLYQITERA